MLGSVSFIVYRAVQSSSIDNTRIVNAHIRDIEKKMTISGIVQPLKEIEIKSTISGVVEELYVQVGDEVDFGDPIARVQYVKDPMEYKRLKIELTVAKTRLDNAKSNFERTRTLYRKDVIASEEYENAKSNLSVLQSEYNSVASELNMLQGKYNRNDVSNIIKATDSGTVLELPIKEGGSVMARGTLNEGTTVARIADLKSLVFKGNVLESDVILLREGMSMLFSMVAAKDIKITGILSMIAPKGFLQDGVSRFEITADLDIPDSYRSYIKAGSTVNAETILERKEQVFALEEKYFQFSYDSVFVEVETAKGRYEKRFLQTGISDGVYTEILSGIDSLSMIKVNY
jgi:HlyD family secretion protein